MYTSTQIAELLSCTDETVRARSNEFSEFLSSTAKPQKGRQRGYSEDDLRVLALVNERRKTGARFEDIHLALRNGEIGNIPQGTVTSKPATQERGRAALLQAQLVDCQAHTEQEKQARYKAEAKVGLLTEQLADAQVRIERLNREIGKLEG